MSAIKVICTFIAGAVLSSGQTATKGATAPTTKKATAPIAKKETATPVAKPNLWQRGKECADQAEKVMADIKTTALKISSWENHYSPKYDKCFVSYFGTDSLQDVAIFTHTLIDGFERATLAYVWKRYPVTGGSIQLGKLEGAVRSIDSEDVNCEKAGQFIDEHMKN
jgi:hypothetical protein